MEDTKAIEDILFAYKGIPLEIRRLNLEIKILENTYEVLPGKGSNEIMSGSRTNQVSSSVENALISKENRIAHIRNEISRLEITKEMVEIAMESLTTEEKKVIQLRYFDKVSVSNLVIQLNLTKCAVYNWCKRIIDKKMKSFIIIMN